MLALNLTPANVAILERGEQRLEIAYRPIADRPFLTLYDPRTFTTIYLPVRKLESLFVSFAFKSVTVRPLRLRPTTASIGFRADPAITIYRALSRTGCQEATPNPASGTMPHELDTPKPAHQSARYTMPHVAR